MNTRLLLLGLFVVFFFLNNLSLNGQNNENNIPCPDLKIDIQDNDLTISGFDAPNKIIKVFDKTYKLLLECTTDCGSEIDFNQLNDGVYFLDVQLYDENWELICFDQREITVFGTFCTPAFCPRDVILNSQAEVDAFCGCEEIAGSLLIGEFATPNDITNLAALQNLKIVRGGLRIRGTQLKNFKDLANLVKLTTIQLEDNPLVVSLEGFEQIESIGSMVIENQGKLTNFKGLDNLREIFILVINGNPVLQNLSALSQLQTVIAGIEIRNNPVLVSPSLNVFQTVTSLTGFFWIINNDQLTNLNGFNNLKSTGDWVWISENDNLESLDALQQLTFVDGRFILEDNPKLVACCTITPLLDEDVNNGQITGNITINNNAPGCSSVEQILLNCNETPCDTAICQGDVILRTQAEVDAFCGCEKITGALVVGNPNGNSLSDIISLANLKGLRQVDSTIIITQTILETLVGLEGLETIGASLSIGNNPSLKNVNGLEQLSTIGRSINFGSNPELVYISSLSNLKKVKNILLGSCPINDISVFSNLQINSLNGLSLTAMSQLATLNGLEKIERININDETGGRGKLLLGGNPLLQDISALSNLTFVGLLVIDRNEILADCCPIRHLIDGDIFNGNANLITIQNNPSFCNSIQAIKDNCPTSNATCATIEISTEEHQITFTGLSAPNVIAKVFDKDYQIIFNCTGNCGETETITNLTADGIYHTDVQFYDKNWQFICEDKQDIIVIGGNEPCDTSICTGDVYFSSQAEIDAFCGCTVIQGNLIIAGIPSGGLTGELTDVVSLAKFSGLKRIEGTFTIVESQIVDYSGLEDLEYVGDGFAAVQNNSLTSFKGVEQLERINRNLAILGNPQLRAVSNFESLNYIGTQLFIDNNDKLSKIEGFANLIALGENNNFQDAKSLGINNNAELVEISAFNQLSTADQLSVNANPNLLKINGFEQLRELQQLVIARNNELVDIGLATLTNIGNSLNVTGNPALEACCVLTPFLDGENSDGTPIGFINVSDNKGNCATVAAVLAACQTPTKPSCRDIEIQTSNTQITISNLNAPIEILKIFDKNYRIIYECFAHCEETIRVADLPTGMYHLGVNFYDKNWKDICELIEKIHVGDENRTQDRHIVLAAQDFRLAPNPALTATFIDLSQLKNHAVKLELVNQFGQAVWSKNIEKVTTTPTKIDLTTISNGLYFLQIQAKGRRVVGKKLLVNRLY